MNKITVIILITILVLGIIAFVDIKGEFVQIQGQLAHLDEEVDEAAVGVKRLLLRESTGAVAKDNLSEIPRVQLDAIEYDFGQISKEDGIVQTDFFIGNSGKGNLVIGEMLTSCSCTSVIIDSNTIEFGKEAVITVSFDPNFHEEPQGRFFRSVFVFTNDPDNKEVELRIFVEIKD